MTVSEIIYVNGTYTVTHDNTSRPSMGFTKVDLIGRLNAKIAELQGQGKTILSISIMPNGVEAHLVVGTQA